MRSCAGMEGKREEQQQQQALRKGPWKAEEDEVLISHVKSGCKFSAEEERVVIELQAQFGNKWARIATHLPGRTDNDVKNFWSSRQKRLARILQASSSKQHKHKREVPVVPHHNVPIVEIPKLSSSAGGRVDVKGLLGGNAVHHRSSAAAEAASAATTARPAKPGYSQC
ncbi:hypothetical protein NL676_009475 [Syzygium grande]|nr:hypothetical protein NL676_009475 [Syzygium grande]